MCCLFGFHDYGHKLTRKQRSQLLSLLSIASEERGTDATGIAYNEDGIHRIYKRPIPARFMWYRVPLESTVVMGHTRMTTQGDAAHNENNHPFRGYVKGTTFSLAHNGVLYNDKSLRRKMKLPASKIETDSYVALQLVESYGELSFKSLKAMAEKLEGTFNLTLLSDKDELYFVKGNNPLCIYHFPKQGLYVYASTEGILKKALRQIPFLPNKGEEIRIFSGDILCIGKDGSITKADFDDSNIHPVYSRSFFHWPGTHEPYTPLDCESEYIEDLKAVACCFSYYPEQIDELLRVGFTPEEIEEYLYCG